VSSEIRNQHVRARCPDLTGVYNRYRRLTVAIVAGIDEAGLGPVLGPLVMCASAFEVPDPSDGQSLWELLAPAVVRKPKRKSAALPIADSKKLFNRKSKRALRHLERAVLSMLAVGGRRPETVADLLAVVTLDAQRRAQAYPWYHPEKVALPRSVSGTDVALSANSLGVAMRKAGVRLLTIRAEPVFVGEFNRIVRATRNKSTAAISVMFRLVAHLWTRLKSGRMLINIDRQGGRMRYLSHLERAFEGCSFRILGEDEDRSTYEMSDARRTAEITFAVNSEQAHLPVALSSMAGKYLREIFMEMFNEYWSGHVESLASTAGYYTDGRRFFGEITAAMKKLNVDKDMVYRCR